MTIYELKRNDVEGALEVYRQAVEQSAPDIASIFHTLLRLQDDADELLARIRSLDTP